MTDTATPVRVLLSTSAGNITLSLDAEKAPKTVANFVEYVKAGHYDGLVFHRVIKGFMIQGGGYDAEYNQKRTRAPIQNEAKNGLKNKRGTIAMARTGEPHSASSQFFINHGDNDFLDYPGQDGWGYAVFGRRSDRQHADRLGPSVRPRRAGDPDCHHVGHADLTSDLQAQARPRSRA